MRTDITAEQRGRHLYITVAAGSEDAIEYKVVPAPADTGVEMFATALQLYTGNVTEDTVEQRSTDMLVSGFGQENYDKAVAELRASEFQAVAYAAFFWNAHGGGFELVQTLFQDGLPKAIPALLENAGVQMVPALPTSPSTESENPTP